MLQLYTSEEISFSGSHSDYVSIVLTQTIPVSSSSQLDSLCISISLTVSALEEHTVLYCPNITVFFFSLLFFPMIQSHATMHTVLFSDSMYCTPFLCQAQSNSLPRVCNTVHLCSQYSIYMATVVHPQKCLNNYLMRSNPF